MVYIFFNETIANIMDQMESMPILLRNCMLLTGKENEEDCRFAQTFYDKLKYLLQNHPIRFDDNNETNLWDGYFYLRTKKDTIKSSSLSYPPPMIKKIRHDVKILNHTFREFENQYETYIHAVEDYYSKLEGRISRNLKLWYSNFFKNKTFIRNYIIQLDSHIKPLSQAMEKIKIYQIPTTSFQQEYDNIIQQYERLHKLLEHQNDKYRSIYRYVVHMDHIKHLINVYKEKKKDIQETIVSPQILAQYIQMGDKNALKDEKIQMGKFIITTQIMRNIIKERLEEYEQYTKQFKSLTQKKTKLLHYLNDVSAYLDELNTWMEQNSITDKKIKTVHQELAQFIKLNHSIVQNWGHNIKDLGTKCVYTDSKNNDWCIMEPSRYKVDSNAPEYRRLHLLSKLLSQDLDVYEKEIMRSIQALQKTLDQMKKKWVTEFEQEYKAYVKKVRKIMNSTRTISEKTFKDVSAELYKLSKICPSKYYENNTMEISYQTKKLKELGEKIKQKLESTSNNNLGKQSIKDMERDYNQWYEKYISTMRNMWQTIYNMKRRCNNMNPNVPWYKHVWSKVWKKEVPQPPTDRPKKPKTPVPWYKHVWSKADKKEISPPQTNRPKKTKSPSKVEDDHPNPPRQNIWGEKIQEPETPSPTPEPENLNLPVPWYEHVWKTIWKDDAMKAVRNQLIRSGLDEKAIMDSYKKGQIKDVLKAASVVGLAGIVGYMGYRLWQQQRNQTSSADDYRPQYITYTIQVVDMLDNDEPGYLDQNEMLRVVRLIDDALHISKTKNAGWYKRLQSRIQRLAKKVRTTTSNVVRRFMLALGIINSTEEKSLVLYRGETSSVQKRFRVIEPGTKYEMVLEISPVLREGIRQTILQQLMEHDYTTSDIINQTKHDPNLIIIIGESKPLRINTPHSPEYSTEYYSPTPTTRSHHRSRRSRYSPTPTARSRRRSRRSTARHRSRRRYR